LCPAVQSTVQSAPSCHLAQNRSAQGPGPSWEPRTETPPQLDCAGCRAIASYSLNPCRARLHAKLSPLFSCASSQSCPIKPISCPLWPNQRCCNAKLKNWLCSFLDLQHPGCLASQAAFFFWRSRDRPSPRSHLSAHHSGQKISGLLMAHLLARADRIPASLREGPVNKHLRWRDAFELSFQRDRRLFSLSLLLNPNGVGGQHHASESCSGSHDDRCRRPDRHHPGSIASPNQGLSRPRQRQRRDVCH